jgi:hypothetical protein
MDFVCVRPLMASSYQSWAGPRAPTLTAEKLVRIPVDYVPHLFPPVLQYRRQTHNAPQKCLLKSHFSGLVSFIEWLLKIILKRKKPSPHKQVTRLFTYFSNKLNCYSPGPNKGAYTMLKLLLALPQGGRERLWNGDYFILSI